MTSSSPPFTSSSPRPPWNGISCVFPCYNEGGNIARAVKLLSDALETEVELATSIVDYEIIVVDDGSRDASEAEVRRLGDMNPRVRLVQHEQNQGYGAAIRSGITKAQFDVVFYADSDNQFDYSQVREWLPLMNENPVVCGYRIDRKDNALRLLNAFGWNLLVRMVLGQFVRDLDCGFKMFTRQALRDADLSRLEGRGAIFSAELLLLLKKAGYKFLELPLRHYPRVEGSPTGAAPWVIFRAFRELFLLLLRARNIPTIRPGTSETSAASRAVH